jgi:glycosyltransferase involved in cell wall biosynthesis
VKILALRDQMDWFGNHTGYAQLLKYLPSLGSVHSVRVRRGQLLRYLGSAYARLQGRDGRGTKSLSELEFRLNRWLRRPEACHILFAEENFELLRSLSDPRKNVIATVHLPEATWSEEKRQLLTRISSAIVLYHRDIPFFEGLVGKGRVRFIHHGADTEFFKPDATKLNGTRRILYGGVYLRNEPMLVRVVTRLAEKLPDLQFDLLVPLHHRKSAALAPLLNHPKVTWHAGLNDEQLRDLYQKSYLMLLPMNQSGANTAVVESISSGLPVVTTDVGGIRDYGGGDFFPVVPNNDDDTMVDLVDQYCAKPKWRNEVGRRCRRFAEETLSWPIVARRHVEVYRELIA